MAWKEMADLHPFTCLCRAGSCWSGEASSSYWHRICHSWQLWCRASPVLWVCGDGIISGAYTWNSTASLVSLISHLWCRWLLSSPASKPSISAYLTPEIERLPCCANEAGDFFPRFYERKSLPCLPQNKTQ